MNFLQSVDSSRKETIFFLLICVCVFCACVTLKTLGKEMHLNEDSLSLKSCFS